MKEKIQIIGMWAAGVLLLAGCRTAYREARDARNDILGGGFAVAEARAERLAAESVDRKLGVVEGARLKMLQGDHAGASARFAPLLDELFTEENQGPVYKTGDMGRQVLAATLTDDTSTPWDVPGYALVFALQYEAVESYMLGNRDNARVYLRRATAAQEQMKAAAEADAPTSTTNDANKTASDKAVATVNAKIDAIAAEVRSSYENALAWYLMGAVYEQEGDASNAKIAYDNAAVIAPAASLKRDPKAVADVIVVYEDGLLDPLEPIKIPLPLGTLTSVDFPVFEGQPFPTATVTAGFAGANATTECPAVVNVQALAYRDLKDKIPGIVTRNVTRVATAIAAQQVVNHVKTGSSTADTALQLGVLAYNAVHTVAGEADTRQWQTLPERVHLGRLGAPAGQTTLLVKNGRSGAELRVPLNLVAGETRLVWVSHIGAHQTVATMPLGAKGAAPTWNGFKRPMGP